MATTHASTSAAVRARLDHPVIDSDGHMIEFEPGFLDYLRRVGGRTMVDRFFSDERNTGSWGKLSRWYRLSPEERRDQRATRSPWWALPTKNTRDRATAVLPKLLHERMDEIGLDFTVLYPTLGLAFPHIENAELRRATCRALNMFCADYFREYADRMTPAAVIPMHTPREAIEELECAVRELRLKAIMMAGHVQRPVPAAVRRDPDVAPYAFWLDTFGLDSAYDYDPVWATCVELRVSPTFHSPAMGWGSRTTSNYMYNHTGHFAAAGEAVCKALFFGGVTRRFPTLKFGFLESGVGWAADLYAGIIARWEKRNPRALENYNPANLDRELLFDLYRRYGGKIVQEHLDDLTNSLGLLAGTREDPAALDDWAACRIERAEDIRDLFVPNFYFGCEADDPLNATAFNTTMNPFGARLRAIFSSDIGHWDVPDMSEVLEEAYELVEKGLLSEHDFRDFVFTNPVTLWAGMNPEFFRGTVVEQAAARELARMGKA
ncbi:MAG: amidohydrolase family protein [Thermodesulfobacteriota bacterium]